MLDPNNPRSVAFQIDRIEIHLAALPIRTDRRPAVAGAAGRRCDRHRFRTANAGRIGDAEIIDIEAELMKLSETITATYLTHNERPRAVWEALS